MHASLALKSVSLVLSRVEDILGIKVVINRINEMYYKAASE